MTENEFIEELKKLGITATEEQLSKLNKYYELLVNWNEKINLTRIIEKKDVFLKHFYDSLTISKVIDLNAYHTLLDFGTGAGFPGLVLKIFYPTVKITLVDSLQKRVNFLNIVIADLNLTDIEVFHLRVEELKTRKYDIITTRAVANLSKLLDYTKNLMTTETKFIPLKGHIDEELLLAEDQLKKYKLSITKKEEFLLPYENSKRTILVIENKH